MRAGPVPVALAFFLDTVNGESSPPSTSLTTHAPRRDSSRALRVIADAWHERASLPSQESRR